MRLTRLALTACIAAAAFATPATAAVPDPDDYVSVRINGPVVCVTEPCNQPTPVTVCVKQPVAYCTPE